MEPRTAPTTTPVLGELEESERGTFVCTAWLEVEMAVVRKVVGAILHRISY